MKKPLENPFEPKPDVMTLMAHAALPVLLDRAGGSATVSQGDQVRLQEKYGGPVGVAAEEVEPGVYRLTLVKVTPPTDPARPVS